MKKINKSTEERIIQVATDVFALDGFEGASIREICRRAEINISMISYYLGGKKELYEKIVAGITNNIIAYMKKNMGVDKEFPAFEGFSLEEKQGFLFKALGLIVDYFYSSNITDEQIMIFFREQITSGVPLNAMGYNVFRKLIASIMGKEENDKEVIFRCITIIGQVHSARILKQFSLKVMNQKEYTQEDTLLFKEIVISQTKAIISDLGVR